jgi:hypothetical protein
MQKKWHYYQFFRALLHYWCIYGRKLHSTFLVMMGKSHLLNHNVNVASTARYYSQ